MPPRRPPRLSVTALLLSAALVGTGVLGVLRWQPSIPGLGVSRMGAPSSAGLVREASPGPAPGCREDRRVIHGGYRFLPACAGQAPSFDGRYFVVKNAGLATGVGLVRGGSGASLDDLGQLDDGHRFTIFWAPSSYRFFANQQQDGAHDRFLLFEVREGHVVRRPALGEAALAAMLAQRPCLAAGDVTISGVRWSRDGTRIALLATAGREACGGAASWRPLWMIGDAASGRIDPGSVRSRSGRAPLPADGPYAAL